MRILQLEVDTFIIIVKHIGSIFASDHSSMPIF